MTGGPGEILTPPALARMHGARVVDRIDGTAHVVDRVDHPPGDQYLIHWVGGGVCCAGARHPFTLEQT